MSRYKVINRKFIIAAMTILLCLISITGATLALFTSDVKDGTIGINATAGNVKVDIVDAQDKQTSLVGKELDFLSASPDGKVLFEPGATYCTEGFRVKNIGDIPINYILYVSEDDTISEDFNDAFEAWITNDLSDLRTAIKLTEYTGELAPDACSDVYYLVFRMKETAGNEYQDRTFTGVGVTVCAVQGNADN